MADRIFAGLLLLVAIGYTIIAFTIIRAPFQYDPLGPESWPRLLGLASIACCIFVLLRPDVENLGIGRATVLRLLALVTMLLGYAWLFQPLGFIFSTWLFCIALSLMLGAKPLAAGAFGAAAGVIGYLVCTILLDLNLPAGILKSVL